MKKLISSILLAILIMIFGGVDRTQAAAGWADALDFSEGLSAVKIDGKWGFIDKTGATVINPQYDDAWPFYDGMAKISLNGKWGFIDKKGTLVIDPQFYKVDNFHNGLAKAVINGQQCFIDKTGAVVITPKFYIVTGFDNGLAEVSQKNIYGFIDKTGAVAIPLQYNSLGPFKDGMCSIKTNDKYGFIDRKGTTVVPPQFDNVEDFSENLAAISINGKHGYINTKGNTVILPQFNEASSFSEGLAAINIGNKYGFINKNGAIVIPAKFDYAGSFQDGVAAIEAGDKWSFIDKTGTVIIPPQFEQCYPCGEGLAIIKKDGRYGFFNNAGTAIIPAQLDQAYKFSDGWARIYFNGRYDFINKFGQFLSAGTSSDNMRETETSKTALAALQRAQNFIDRNQYDEAINIANAVIEADISNDIAYTIRGQAYMRKKDYYQAKTNFEKALALNPDATTNKGLLNECKYLIAQQKEKQQELQQENENIIQQCNIGDSVLVIRWHSSWRGVDYGYSGIIREINSPYLTLEITDFYNVNTDITGDPATGGKDLIKSRDVGKTIKIEARYITSFGKIVTKQQPATSSPSNVDWVNLDIDIIDGFTPSWSVVNFSLTNLNGSADEASPGYINGSPSSSGSGIAIHKGLNSSLAGKYRWTAICKNNSGEKRFFGGVITVSGTKGIYTIRVYDDGKDAGSGEI